MTEQVNFFNFTEDKLFYDERKKRFIYLDNAPSFAQKEFKNSHFKS